MMAPFTPFFTELLYQNLQKALAHQQENGNRESVHYLYLPEPQKKLINVVVERKVSHMQDVIDIGRLIRERNTLPVKYPLPELVVIHEDPEYLSDVKSLEKFIIEELNIKCLTVTSDKTKYGVHLRAEPDTKSLGIKFRATSKIIAQAVKDLTELQIAEFQNKGSIVVSDHELQEGDLRLVHCFSGEKSKELSEKYQAHSANGVLVLLDVTPDQDMLDEGIAREVINRIQKLRKKAHLVPSDPITVYISVEPATDNLNKVIKNLHEFIESTLKVPLKFLPHQLNTKPIIQEKTQVKTAQLEMVIFNESDDPPKNSDSAPKQSKPAQLKHSLENGKNSLEKKSKMSLENSKNSSEKKSKISVLTNNDLSSNGSPECRYVNVVFCDSSNKTSKEVPHGTVLLENPRGQYCLSLENLQRMVKIVFDLQGKNPKLFLASDRKQELSNLTKEDILNLHTRTLYAYVD